MPGPLALCLVEDSAAREQACEALTAAGFDVLGFDDCRLAGAWLEEETPRLAVVAVPVCEACSSVARELSVRHVPVLTPSESHYRMLASMTGAFAGPAWF